MLENELKFSQQFEIDRFALRKNNHQLKFLGHELDPISSKKVPSIFVGVSLRIVEENDLKKRQENVNVKNIKRMQKDNNSNFIPRNFVLSSSEDAVETIGVVVVAKKERKK